MDFKQAYDICRKKMDIHIDKYPLNVPEVGGCKDGRYYDKEWKTPLVNKWTWLGSFITGFGPLFYKKEKSNELGFGEPCNIPGLRQPTKLEDWRSHNWWELRIGCQQGDIAPNPETGLYDYQIQIANHYFSGNGIGPFQAKMDAEWKALNFLWHEEVKRKIKKIDYSNAVSQLHEFVQKQIIMEPIYDFSEYHDEDGNPIWRCKVTLEGIPKRFVSEGVSKKEVKQEAALQLLKFFVETEIEESERFETPVFFRGSLSLLSDEEKKKLIQKFDSIRQTKQ